MSKPFKIANMEVLPGETKRGKIPVLSLADGSEVSLPIVVINGAKDGPIAYLGAGIHGDEVNGIAILAREIGRAHV
jgi:uncharacterized protein